MNDKTVVAGAIGLAFLVLFAVAVAPGVIPWPAVAPLKTDMGTMLWGSRTYELLLQAVILLGGVVAILLLLEESRRGART